MSALAQAQRTSSPFEYLYLLLIFALAPLVLSVARPSETKSVEERLKAAIERANEPTAAKIQALSQQEDGDLDDLLSALPDGKLDDVAHLPRNTMVHWVYAGITAIAFWFFALMLFPGERKTAHHLLLVGLFTGTVGIVLLLGFQFAAGATQGVWVRGRGVRTLLFYVVKFIGWSYNSASDPDSNFLLSFIGFTCGVGLCEELCKAVPILAHFRRVPSLGWGGAAVWGIASGVGFGVAEGIMYSGRYYNGIASYEIYFVRFVSCVALHAIWAASVGISIWKHQEEIQGEIDWGPFSLSVLQILAVPMILHGLYDTLLKKEMDLWALAISVLSFAWFAFQVETARAAVDTTAKQRPRSSST